MSGYPARCSLNQRLSRRRQVTELGGLTEAELFVSPIPINAILRSRPLGSRLSRGLGTLVPGTTAVSLNSSSTKALGLMSKENYKKCATDAGSSDSAIDRLS